MRPTHVIAQRLLVLTNFLAPLLDVFRGLAARLAVPLEEIHARLVDDATVRFVEHQKRLTVQQNHVAIATSTHVSGNGARPDILAVVRLDFQHVLL